MKTLELNSLPAPVLLVWGLPEDTNEFSVHTDRELGHQFKYLSVYRGPECPQLCNPLPKGNWQLIGKLSELTEEIIATFVEGNPASDTFCMSIEASGHYLAKCVDAGPYGGGYDSKWIKEYEEAQSKTLPANTLIFKKL